MARQAPVIERRDYRVALRVEAGSSDAPEIQGEAAVFGEIADLYWFRERFEAGAFGQTILEDDIRALVNHDPNYVLGRNQANTLTLSETASGLSIVNIPPDTQWARDLLVSMRRGDITQMSIGFETKDAEWETQDGEDVRVIKRAKLWDVSVVTFPAYTSTSASVRAAELVYEQRKAALEQEHQAGSRGQHEQEQRLRVLRSQIEARARLK